MPWEVMSEVVRMDQKEMTGVANLAGKDGWELCGLMAVPIQAAPKFDAQGIIVAQNEIIGCLLTFKRPVYPAPSTAKERNGVHKKRFEHGEGNRDESGRSGGA